MNLRLVALLIAAPALVCLIGSRNSATSGEPQTGGKLSPSVRLLFDIYHQQITEGNLIASIAANLGKISHFHVADVPGRHQPGTGELNYPDVFRAIAAKGPSEDSKG